MMKNLGPNAFLYGYPAPVLMVGTSRRNHCRCVIETKTVASLQESLNWLVTHWSNK
ncbi:hypothetical protein [Clostridium sp. E02]|uniref:hypothetical protein n=1 Tax=Clostridium sp. E02 TaxID=2487134 RepID=UPI001FA9D0E5|nr:hypothetical protein [Clostridium sp. E02]